MNLLVFLGFVVVGSIATVVLVVTLSGILIRYAEAIESLAVKVETSNEDDTKEPR